MVADQQVRETSECIWENCRRCHAPGCRDCVRQVLDLALGSARPEAVPAKLLVFVNNRPLREGLDYLVAGVSMVPQLIFTFAISKDDVVLVEDNRGPARICSRLEVRDSPPGQPVVLTGWSLNYTPKS